MLSKDEIRADYVSTVKRLMSGNGGCFDEGYAAALKNVLCFDDDDWKKLVAEDLRSKECDDMERRLKLIEEAVEGMEKPRAMRFLLAGMQEHINKRVPKGSMRSEQQNFLYAMIQKWKLELKYNKI